jgi:protein-S-isoprenylcysteine O-methyltransferase Ste14
MERLLAIYVISIAYAFFEMSINFRKRKSVKVVLKGDQGSLRFLTISIAVGYFLCFTFAYTKYGRIELKNLMLLAGAVLIIAGLIIRIISIRQLKQYFTFTVSKVKGHTLIDNGLYKHIRHPGYLGQLIIFTGISVLLSNWLSILAMVLPVLAGFLYRIRTEEKFMAEQMGQVYLDYRQRTKKLIPGIF